MTVKMTVWISALLFIAMMYNVVGAYTAMGDVNVQTKFEQIGLLEDTQAEFLIPPRKPLRTEQLASRE